MTIKELTAHKEASARMYERAAEIRKIIDEAVKDGVEEDRLLALVTESPDGVDL